MYVSYIKNIFYDKMVSRFFYFHVTRCCSYHQTIIGEVHSQKEGFLLRIWRLGERFNLVPRNVWWALRKPGVVERLGFLRSIYKNTRSWVRVNGSASHDFLVQLGHQGSLLKLMYFSSYFIKRKRLKNMENTFSFI